MNILVVAPEYPPNVVGGGGGVYQTICEFFAGRGHVVTVLHGDFAIGAKGAISRMEHGVRVISLPQLPFPKAMPWIMPAMPPRLESWPGIFRLLRQKWDVAHLHGVGFPLIDTAALGLRSRGTPYVFTSHSVPSTPAAMGGLPALAIRTYLGALTRFTARGAHQCTAVSEATASDPIFPLPSNRVVIHNGLFDAQFDKRETIPHEQIVCSAGRITKLKGLDVAIRAIAELRATKGLSIAYDIWGDDGGDRAEFERLAGSLGVPDLVRFRGRFEPQDRTRVLSRYRALLMPSRMEPFGLAALEAMALGVPVIASNCGGLGELMRGLPTLVEPNDVSGLAGKLEWIARDDDRWIAARDAAYERARGFRWATFLPMYEACLVDAARSNAEFHDSATLPAV